MALRLPLTAAPAARSPSWAALAAVMLAGSLAAWLLPAAWLDWQPEHALQQPWRAFTAAFVHWSPLHLGTNVLAAAVVGAYGWAAGVPLRATLAWVLAWPLTHVGLLLQPALAHYGGLSGVLHGGVAVVSLWLLLGSAAAADAGRRRFVGVAVLLGLAIKLLGEEPWGPPLRSGTEWDIAVAPLAHATGALAGALCAAAVVLGARAWQRQSPASKDAPV